VSADVEAITERWVHGKISTARIRDLVRRLHGVV
jgi:hypothetical protein